MRYQFLRHTYNFYFSITGLNSTSILCPPALSRRSVSSFGSFCTRYFPQCWRYTISLYCEDITCTQIAQIQGDIYMFTESSKTAQCKGSVFVLLVLIIFSILGSFVWLWGFIFSVWVMCHQECCYPNRNHDFKYIFKN